MPQQDNVECEYEAEGVTNYYQCNTVVSIIANHQIIKSKIPVPVLKRRTNFPVLRGGGNQALPESIHCFFVFCFFGGGVPLF